MIIHLIVTDTIRKFGCQARSTQRITDIEESVSSYKRYREQVLRSAARLDFRRATFFWCSCRQRWTDCRRNSRADRSRRAAHSSIIYVLFLNSQERTLQSCDRGEYFPLFGGGAGACHVAAARCKISRPASRSSNGRSRPALERRRSRFALSRLRALKRPPRCGKRSCSRNPHPRQRS